MIFGYQLGGGISDRRVYSVDHYVDQWYSNCPLGLQYVMDNHPSWILWDRPNPPGGQDYQIDNYGHYYVHVENQEFAQTWASKAKEKLLLFPL